MEEIIWDRSVAVATWSLPSDLPCGEVASGTIPVTTTSCPGGCPDLVPHF